MKSLRDSRLRRFQRWLGGKCQVAAWWLTDCHDTWLIDYRAEDGKVYGMTRRVHYRTACAIAREVKGEISGAVRAVHHSYGDDRNDGADWWKGAPQP